MSRRCLALDALTYLKPARSPGVITLRGIVPTDLATSGAQPFFVPQSLGGGELLRRQGVESGRSLSRRARAIPVRGKYLAYRWQ